MSNNFDKNSNLRALGRGFFETAVAAADPVQAVDRALCNVPLPVLAKGKYLIVAVGKAATAMSSAALPHLPTGRDFTALAVTNYENQRDISGVQVYGAGHPVPDENGLKAAQRVEQHLQDLGPHDFILCLISGGGSALLPAPVAGISLADKQMVNQLMLANGLDITEINTVRQHLSRLKGGGLARLAAPARLRSLIISDVIGDDLRTIASGPTASPLASKAQARAILEQHDLWGKLPTNVQNVLSAPDDVHPETYGEHILIGSNRQSLRAIKNPAQGWNTQIMRDDLQGDVAQAASQIAQDIRANPHIQLMIWGGETTVTLTGTGKGGRNQELALRVAQELHDLPGKWVFLSGGTDGRDGPTDAAGGIVDQGTLTRLSNIETYLNNNDSYHALQKADDLLITGATGTNVADVQIFIRYPN